MQKYSFKTKLEIVKIYNRGEAGMKHLAKLYGTNKVSVKIWIHVYNNLGIKGLRPLKKSPTYSFAFKKNIVKLYLKGNISYMDLVDRFRLKDPSTIKGWVQTYKKKGVKGLIPRKGALFIMPKKVKNAKRNLEKIPKTMEEALKLLKEQKHLLELKEIEIEFIKKEYFDSTKRITNKEITRIVYSILFQKKYKLKDVLKVAKLSKATYMRWIKRLNEKDKDYEIKEEMIQIRQENPNYGYRRICAELRHQGIVVNNKKILRLVQELQIQVTSFSRKSGKFSTYKGEIAKSSKK